MIYYFSRVLNWQNMDQELKVSKKCYNNGIFHQSRDEFAS